MSEFKLKLEKIVGPASEGAICGVFKKSVPVAETSATLISCFSLSTSGEVDGKVILSDLVELISNKFDEVGGGEGPLDILRAGSIAAGNYVSSKHLKVSFVNVLFYEEACYFSREGDSVKFFVFRAPKKVEISFKDGSGPVREGQIYLLATNAFLKVFDIDELASEAGVDLEGVIDGISTDISEEKNKAEIAAAFVEVKSPEEEAKHRRDETLENVKAVETEELGTVSEAGGDEGGTEAVGQREEVLQDDLDIQENPRFKIVQAFLEKASGYLSGFLHRVSKEMGALKRGDGGAIVRLRKKLVFVSIILLLVLGSSGLVAYKGKIRDQKKQEAAAYIASASTKYSEALAILGLNKSRAREILVEADKDVKAALSIDKNDEKAIKLSADIITKLKETESLANVNFKTVLEKEGKAVGLSISDKNLYAVYEDNIYSVALAGGKAEEEAEVESADDGLVSSGDAVVSDSGKIEKIKLSDGKKTEIGDVSGLSDLGVFVTNVYALSPDKIEKFVPVEAGYVSGGNYLSEKMNFENTARLSIDGNVWVASGGNIYKFLRGEKQNFEISGLTGGNSSFGEIYTNAEIDNLYVVDRANSALLVIGKDGVYKKAYQADEFGQAKGIAVNTDESKVYIAVGNKVLETSL